MKRSEMIEILIKENWVYIKEGRDLEVVFEQILNTLEQAGMLPPYGKPYPGYGGQFFRDPEWEPEND